ncbi:MAG: UDP-3-O-acyl-N-acetylglucosamine deacetylase [Bacillota bacterium]
MLISQGKETTIKNKVSLDGIGLHTGRPCRLTVKPAGVGQGIIFQRLDLDRQPRIPAEAACLVSGQRSTSLGQNGQVLVQTVEHFLAAAAGLAYDNMLVEISGPELPACDGSARQYFNLLRQGGQEEQEQERQQYLLKKPVAVGGDGAQLFCLPVSKTEPPYRTRFEYFLDYGVKPPGIDRAECDLSSGNLEEIFAARTFVLAAEIEGLQQAGLARGGTVENAVIFGETGPDKPLRIPNEAAAHKLIDLIGDLYLAGPVLARFIAIKSGHTLNQKLARKLAALIQSE